MNILVLGGSGFLSGRFVQHALAAGHQLICVTRGQKPLDPRISQHISLPREEIPYNLPDTIAYQVVVDFIGMNPEQLQQTIALARKCQRLIMISSDYAYHPAHRPLFLREEQARFSDLPDYGGAKRQAEERILHAQNNGMVQAIILRPPHIYGPGSWPGTIPKHGRRATLLEEIQSGKPLQLLGGGLGLIQPIHVDDLARIIVALLDNERAYGEDFTACGPDLLSHLDYYRTIAELLEQPLSVTPYCPEGPAPDVNAYVGGHRCYDRSKLARLLPEFTYTPFRLGMAEWVRHLIATSSSQQRVKT
ncbi:NAD-dependent epimerase/dehydratase family protein [Candidatus Magnetaquicoccus inordinatus]|uniref:NAD-dependent epimerase/dehydratase family protein n=1 Tax=Candidatus Magnetaquicoccus inordinatus TaxID=2496818 RepID=UPI00102CE5CC|nr:NAD-dependent epimerase/dehydratase family protein [Candidatus Magnetaquicoccus inordinatus]